MVNIEQLLKKAREEKYAIPQFNINNLEWTKYVLEVCEKEKSPVILGVSEGSIKYMGGYNVVSKMVEGLLLDLQITVPVALHLDHGTSVKSCQKAVAAGFTSVMIDGSSYPLEDNIQMTKDVVRYAKSHNVSVEAEIGKIQADESIGVEEAFLFYKKTGVTALAPAVGTVHGIFYHAIHLQYELLEVLYQKGILLVLHGGSGLEEDSIKKAIACGICKVNINTDLQLAWASAVRNYVKQNSSIYDPRKIISSGEDACKQIIREKLYLLGSNGKA